MTYLLTFILILLVAVFVVSVKYQSWIVQHAKLMVQHIKQLLGIEKPPPPKPRPGGVLGKWERETSLNVPMPFHRQDFLAVRFSPFSAR